MTSPTPLKKITPGLYIVATPIGNMADMTFRAVDTLRAADVILCEDTRVTGHLLKYYDINTRLQVYNEQTEGRDHGQMIERVQKGQVVALVSDAGMPLLSDPGYQLIRACVEAGVAVTSVPGASAILTGLQLSALPTDAFLFMGFLPNKVQERQSKLRDMAGVKATLILFERASRVGDLLSDIKTVLGARQVVIARELTKLFEDVRRGDIDTLVASLTDNPIKGEVVVLIDRAHDHAEMDDAALGALLRVHMADKPLRQAVDDVAGLTGTKRRRVYDLALEIRDGA